MFIFDVGDELNTSSVNQLVKANRHCKSKIILSSQLNDMTPQARRQMDYVIVFGGQSPDKLETLHKELDLSVPFETFSQISLDATSHKYDFLYIDVNSELFRKNFNQQFQIV